MRRIGVVVVWGGMALALASQQKRIPMWLKCIVHLTSTTGGGESDEKVHQYQWKKNKKINVVTIKGMCKGESLCIVVEAGGCASSLTLGETSRTLIQWRLPSRQQAGPH